MAEQSIELPAAWQASDAAHLANERMSRTVLARAVDAIAGGLHLLKLLVVSAQSLCLTRHAHPLSGYSLLKHDEPGCRFLKCFLCSMYISCEMGRVRRFALPGEGFWPGVWDPLEAARSQVPLAAKDLYEFLARLVCLGLVSMESRDHSSTCFPFDRRGPLCSLKVCQLTCMEACRWHFPQESASMQSPQ